MAKPKKVGSSTETNPFKSPAKMPDSTAQLANITGTSTHGVGGGVVSRKPSMGQATAASKPLRVNVARGGRSSIVAPIPPVTDQPSKLATHLKGSMKRVKNPGYYNAATVAKPGKRVK